MRSTESDDLKKRAYKGRKRALVGALLGARIWQNPLVGLFYGHVALTLVVYIIDGDLRVRTGGIIPSIAGMAPPNLHFPETANPCTNTHFEGCVLVERYERDQRVH